MRIFVKQAEETIGIDQKSYFQSRYHLEAAPDWSDGRTSRLVGDILRTFIVVFFVAVSIHLAPSQTLTLGHATNPKVGKPRTGPLRIMVIK